MVQVVKVVSRGVAYRVPGGQGVGLQGLRVSRGRPKGSQGVKGYAYGVPGGLGVAYRVPGGLEVGLEGPTGSRNRPTGSYWVKG